MRIKDLSPYTYSKRKGLEDAISVGWLEGDDMTYNHGETPKELVSLLKGYKTQNRMMGSHKCEYCSQYGTSIPNGNGEIWVFNGDKFYIAPYLIIHYIEKHGYKPPQEFIEAVMNGFMPHSPGYEMRLNQII